MLPDQKPPLPGWTPVLAGVALVIALLPFLRSGFYSDDIVNSTLPGILENASVSLWQFIQSINHVWSDKGRFYPVGLAATYLTWDLAPGLLANRLVQVGLIVSNVFAAMWLLRTLGYSRAAAWAFAALMPAFFQARAYYDPQTSFSPLLQLSLLLVLLTVGGFGRAFGPWRPWAYLGSVCAYGLALATYEVGLVALAMLAGLALLRFPRRPLAALSALSAHGVLTMAWLGVHHYLKLHASTAYAGTQVRLGAKLLPTFAKQASAALPLSYAGWDPQGVFTPRCWPDEGSLLLATLLFVAVAGALLGALGAVPRPLPGSGPRVLLAGAALALSPALLIGVSSRYQDELLWGLGYLPVYLQIYGLALGVTVVICWLAQRAGHGAGWRVVVVTPLALVGAGLSALTFLANQRVIEAQNVSLRYPRELTEDAARHGLFDSVAAGSTILKDPLEPWNTPDFSRQFAGKNLSFLSTADYLATQPDTFYSRRESAAGLYEWRCAPALPGTGSGLAILSRITTFTYRKQGPQAAMLARTLDPPVCYVETRPSGVGPAPAIVVSGYHADGGSLFSAFQFNLASLPVVQSGSRWKLVNFHAGQYQNLSSEVPRLAGGEPPPHHLFLLPAEPTGADGTPDATAPLRLVDHAQASSPGAPAPRIAGVGKDCQRQGEALTFYPSLAPRLELNLPGSSRAGGGLAFFVRPEARQGLFAELVSTHTPDARGFTLEQDGSPEANRYHFVVGDGVGWHVVGSVLLPPDEWSLVVFGFSPRHGEVQVAGTQEAGLRVDVGPAPPLNEDIIFLGNWIVGDRPFNGRIAHVSVNSQPFTAAQIADLRAALEAWKLNETR